MGISSNPPRSSLPPATRGSGHSGQQPHHGSMTTIAASSPPGQQKIADADSSARTGVQHPLVDPSNRPQSRIAPGSAANLPDACLGQQATARRQIDQRPVLRPASLNRRCRAERGVDDVGRITMPAPPPNGASSTERCLSLAKARMSPFPTPKSPPRAARPASDDRAARETFSGNRSTRRGPNRLAGPSRLGPCFGVLARHRRGPAGR